AGRRRGPRSRARYPSRPALPAGRRVPPRLDAVNPRPLPEVMRISQARLTAGLDRDARIDLDTHQQIFGAMRRMNARQLIEMVERVDMRGRGRAAFPLGRKIPALLGSATARRRTTVIPVDGTAGEPVS